MKNTYTGWKKESLRYSLDTMLFCSCALSKSSIWQLWAFEEWWQWESGSYQSLEEERHATEETQEKGLFWKFVFRPGSSKIEKKATRYVLSAVGQEDGSLVSAVTLRIVLT